MFKPTVNTDVVNFPDDHFGSSLPEGMTLEAVVGYQNHRNNFTAGVVTDTLNAAVNVFANNPDIHMVSTNNVPVGIDHLHVVVHRSMNDVEDGQPIVRNNHAVVFYASDLGNVTRDAVAALSKSDLDKVTK